MDISDDIFNEYYGHVHDMNYSNFGVPCRIIYPETRVDCQNCIYDSFLKQSTNQYQAGGPIPFTNGVCPYCNGIGYNSVVETEDIKMRVYFDKRSFAKLPININMPVGGVASIGDIADLPKILRSTAVILNTDIEPFKSYRYVLDGEPIPHGLRQSQFFLAIWHRA